MQTSSILTGEALKAMIFYLSEARKEFADGELNENSKTEMFRAYKWLCTGDEWARERAIS